MMPKRGEVAPAYLYFIPKPHKVTHLSILSYTQKNFRRMINPQKGFISDKSVYQPDLPFDKPFFFEKTVKDFSPRCKVINPWVYFLLINPFPVHQPNQPLLEGLVS